MNIYKSSLTVQTFSNHSCSTKELHNNVCELYFPNLTFLAHQTITVVSKLHMCYHVLRHNSAHCLYYYYNTCYYHV